MSRPEQKFPKRDSLEIQGLSLYFFMLKLFCELPLGGWSLPVKGGDAYGNLAGIANILPCCYRSYFSVKK
jgi:hypothetical protein